MNDGEAGTSRGAVVTEDFDVFLNHRGPDVKATFVAHLEEALRFAGHRPFLDARSLMKGNLALQSIDQALAMAKVHVAVVSTGYADSKYCLKELAAIMRSGKPVVPVFYGVEPVDLRWVENGPFATAFQRHESKGRSPKRVQEWRDALAALSEITGFRLADYRSDESKLKRDVVDQVSRLTPSHIPVEVESCRVGLEGSIGRCVQILEEMGGGMGILGIVGMGGIGKTTLAREIYNYYAGHIKFKHMSFLEIYRNNLAFSATVEVSPSRPVDLRKQLLWDLLHVETSGLTDYTNWFRKVSSVGPVLIVLDNIYNIYQFKALVPFPMALHPGSRIIVTSRDRSILDTTEVDYSIFDVAPLDSQNSIRLFNWHAFHSMEVPKDFKDLAEDIVEACGGLALALKVIGSSLFGKRSVRDRETIWVEAKGAMRRSRDVMDVLRWSYDMLPESDQRMFVDITCLFNKKGFSEALSYWTSCEDCVLCGGMRTPHTSFQNLINKSLVSCKEDMLHVHDLLEELGEEIGKLSKTHLTKGNIGEVALKRKHGSTETMALSLRESRTKKFKVEEFSNMPNLHFLELPEGGKLDGDWKCMPRDLRWLEWRNTSLTHVPLDLDLSQLTTLDFSRSSKLVTLWSKSRYSLKGFPNLVRLNLSRCSSILELPDCIGESSRLQDLDLQYCTELKNLPYTIGELKHLQRLSLFGCRRLKTLPQSIGQVSQLRELHLGLCETLTRLPESIGMLKELHDLSIRYCSRLETLPSSIGALSSLTKFHAMGCSSLKTFPPSLLLCSSLGELSFGINSCADLEASSTSSIGGHWTQLRCLELENISGLPFQLDFGAFKCLQYLWVKDKTLKEFPDSIGLLTSLHGLEIECEMLECLPNSLGDLQGLQSFSLSGCANLKKLPKNLCLLTNLTSLWISDCGLLKKLPSSIGSLSRLRRVYLKSCQNMTRLPTSFAQLKNLSSFMMIKCKSLEEEEVLTTLQGMPIWGGTSFTIPPLPPGMLSDLHVDHWFHIKDLPFHGYFDHNQEEARSGSLKFYEEPSGLLSLYQYIYYNYSRSLT